MKQKETSQNVKDSEINKRNEQLHKDEICDRGKKKKTCWQDHKLEFN